jgi:hypothetical protein
MRKQWSNRDRSRTVVVEPTDAGQTFTVTILHYGVALDKPVGYATQEEANAVARAECERLRAIDRAGAAA